MECLGRGRPPSRSRTSPQVRISTLRVSCATTAHRASLPPRAGRYDELNLAHGPGPSDLLPKPVAALQAAAVCRANQQPARVPSSSARCISAATSASRSATYKNRVRGSSAARSAIRSYPSIQRVLSLIPPRLPSASLGSRAPSRHPGRPIPTGPADRISRMKVHAPPGLVIQRTQATDVLTVEIQFRCVLDAQHDSMLAHTLPRALPMRLHDVVPLERRVLHETVGAHRLPALAPERNVAVGFSANRVTSVFARSLRLASPRSTPSNSLSAQLSVSLAIWCRDKRQG